jgi:hypothetical protein
VLNLNSNLSSLMNASNEILYQYPASLAEEYNRGKLFVSSTKLMWSDGKHAIPDYIAPWSTVSSIQTGKNKYCGIRVAEHNSTHYIKFIIGPTNPTNLLILEELRRAIKLVRKHYNSQEPLILQPSPSKYRSTKISSFGIDPSEIIRRYHSHGSIPEDNDENLQHPAIFTTARHRNVQERVRGNRISARVAIFGGKKKELLEINTSPSAKSSNSDLFNRASPQLEQYILRSQSMRNEDPQTVSSGELSANNRFSRNTSPLIEEENPPETGADIEELSMPDKEDMSPETDAPERELGKGNQEEEDQVIESPIDRARRSIAEKKAKREELLRRAHRSSASAGHVNSPTPGSAIMDKDKDDDFTQVLTTSSDARLSDAKRRIEEKKEKRLLLMKRAESIRNGVWTKIEEGNEVREEELMEKESMLSEYSNGGVVLSVVEVKALVARQQDKRAALIRRRSGLV